MSGDAHLHERRAVAKKARVVLSYWGIWIVHARDGKEDKQVKCMGSDVRALRITPDDWEAMVL